MAPPAKEPAPKAPKSPKAAAKKAPADKEREKKMKSKVRARALRQKQQAKAKRAREQARNKARRERQKALKMKVKAKAQEVRAKKAEKPVKARSAFTFFVTDKHAAVHDSAAPRDTLSKLGEMWRAMVDKQVYAKRAEEDKARAQADRAAYAAKYPKRPASPFAAYLARQYAEKKYETVKEASRQAAEEWAKIPDEEKAALKKAYQEQLAQWKAARAHAA